jgi:hypothetical protein
MSLRVSLNGKHRVVLRWASIILFATLTACSGGSSNDNAGTSQGIIRAVRTITRI